ncbi:MAG: LPS assembly lipoprotein LptE [Bacteroidota bacterium]
MTWNRISPTLIFLLLFQGCAIYSFSGASLPPETKTFSLQFQSDVASGPPDLLDKFQQRLGEELGRRTRLKQVASQGDLRMEGVIKGFKYTSVAPRRVDEQEQASLERLTITVQMNYINPYNKEAAFSKRTFYHSADKPADDSREAKEPQLIEDIFAKLVKDIFNATVASW